jgi:hypothetical protein
MDRSRLAVVFAVAALLGGCAHAPAPRCDAGLRPMVQDRLYFGTRRPGGVVTDAEWHAFVADVVAVAFPDGFTSWNADGGWRGADGRSLREASHVVEIVHPADARMDAAIADLMAAYTGRFDQEAVLRVRVPACVAP